METIINELFNNNPSGANKLLESLLADKIIIALAQRKQELAETMFSTLEEGNAVNRKKIKVYFNRLGKESQGLSPSPKHRGRELNNFLQSINPEKIKELISCSIEEAKVANKQKKNDAIRSLGKKALVDRKLSAGSNDTLALGRHLTKQGIYLKTEAPKFGKNKDPESPIWSEPLKKKIRKSNVAKNSIEQKPWCADDYKILQTEEEIDEAKANNGYRDPPTAIRLLKKAGYFLSNNKGKKHDVYVHEKNKPGLALPRHRGDFSPAIANKIADAIKLVST